MCAVRLSPGSVCWSVIAGAAVVHVLGVLSDASVLAGQATGVALTALAAIVLLGAGRGRLAVAGGIGLLAVDAVTSAADSGGPRYLSPFYAPLSAPRPYSVGDDLAWLGEAMSAQVTQHWSALLGIPLICVGTVVTLADRPRTDARWLRWIAWAAVAGVAVMLVADLGGGDWPGCWSRSASSYQRWWWSPPGLRCSWWPPVGSGGSASRPCWARCC